MWCPVSDLRGRVLGEDSEEVSWEWQREQRDTHLTSRSGRKWCNFSGKMSPITRAVGEALSSEELPHFRERQEGRDIGGQCGELGASC